jgi:hypothetical protein
MGVVKLVLAIESQLLREMLLHLFGKEESIDVVQQISDPILLQGSANFKEADWVVISTKLYTAVSDWVNGYIQDNPGVNFFVISGDGSRITLKYLNHPDQEYHELKLDDFLNILRKLRSH